MAEYLEATEVYHDQEAVGDARKVVDVQLISLLGMYFSKTPKRTGN